MMPHRATQAARVAPEPRLAYAAAADVEQLTGLIDGKLLAVFTGVLRTVEDSLPLLVAVRVRNGYSAADADADVDADEDDDGDADADAVADADVLGECDTDAKRRIGSTTA